MAVRQILVLVVIVGSVAGQLTRTDTKTQQTTPVPILRFLDQQNDDGSYTYGFESGDGTYKIETRLATGEVKGKYGYIDADGNLKETVYGGSSERGFEPQIAGVVVAPPTLVDETEQPEPEVVNTVVAVADRPARPGSRFANFKARQNVEKVGNVKIVNGRRAILKKRVKGRRPVTRPTPQPRPAAITERRPATIASQQQQQFAQQQQQFTQQQPQFTQQQQQPPQQQFRTREEELYILQQELSALEQERQATLRLHQQRYNIPSNAAQTNLGYSNTFNINSLGQQQSQQQLNLLGNQRFAAPRSFQQQVAFQQPQQLQQVAFQQPQQLQQVAFQQPQQQQVAFQQPQQNQRELFRSQNIAPVAQGFNPWQGHPFISGYDSGVGEYSYSY